MRYVGRHASLAHLLAIVLLCITSRDASGQIGAPLELTEQEMGMDSVRATARVILGAGSRSAPAQSAQLAIREERLQRINTSPRSGKRVFDIGDTLTFNTERFLHIGWDRTHFTVMYQQETAGASFNLWVETAELDNGNVTQADVDALAELLGVSTPAGSINPGAGVVENNSSIFGEVPNYDGDGILDILWFDIFDDFPSGAPLFGYIAAEDYDPGAPGGEGNQADVLYIDTNPLITDAAYGIDRAKQVATQVHHELIHFNQDPDELPFVTRGLAEWAKLLNGFDSCNGTYLLQAQVEHNLPFLTFGTGDVFLGDVQRGALFTNYLAEQISMDAAVSVVAAPENGADGYRAVLAAESASRSVEDLVLDFHTANYINDVGVDPRFGYQHAACADVKAPPIGTLDGSTGTFVLPTSVEMRAGGVQYFLFENVRNLRFTAAVNDPAAEEDVRLRAILENVNGAYSFVDFVPGGEAETLVGSHRRATIVIFNEQIDDLAATAPVTFSAEWEGTAVVTENVAYDPGLIAESFPNFVSLEADAIQAVRFEVPQFSALAKVFIAPYFESQFTGGEPSDPRDFTLHVWTDDFGFPGAELFAITMSDPRLFDFANTLEIDHASIDLTAYAELTTLPDVIYVGMSNTGADDNNLVLALAEIATENPSFLFGDLGGGFAQWHSLAALDVGGVPLDDRVIPIRAQFQGEAIDTANEEGDDPDSPIVALHPNYPNPFGSQTTVDYSLPESARVRLVVNDLLGREIVVLVNAVQPAGDHRVVVDASSWSSGVYFCTLELASSSESVAQRAASSRTTTRTMMRVR